MIRLLCFVLALAAGNAHAEEWALEPSVSARAFRNSNLQLLPSGGERVSGFSVSPALRGLVRSETREAGLELRATANRYPGRSDLDTFDYRALFTGRLDQERNSYGLTASALRDSTLSTERLATGQPLPRRQRTQLGATPSYARILDETLVLRLESQLSMVRYEEGSGLVPFDIAGGTLSLQKSLDERTTVSATASKSRYDAHGTTRSDTTGAGGSVSHAAGPRLQLSFSLSLQQTETERRGTLLVCPLTGNVNDAVCEANSVSLMPVAVAAETRSTTRSYSAGAIWKLERGLVGLTAGRDLNPTGTGSLVQTDRAGAVWTHAFDERRSASLDVVYLRSRYIDGPGTPGVYLRVSPGAKWQVDPWLSLSAGFAYARQRSGDPAATAASREFSLSAAYAWPRISRSR